MTETIDTSTGEVLSSEDDRGHGARALQAADGGPVAKRSGHLSDVLRMLEDGQFNVDVSEQMRDLGKALEAHAHNNKGAAKGTLEIKLSFVMANGVLVITPDSKVKKPVQKREGTPLFLGEQGSIGRNPPGQPPLFGDRAPSDKYDGPREIKDV